MKYSLLGVLLFCVSSINATHLSYTEGVVKNGDFEVNRVVASGKDFIDVTYQLGGVTIQSKTEGDQEMHLIRMKNASVLEEKGCPELPVINDMLSVASSNLKVEIVEAEFKEYKSFEVIPSRGPLVQSKADTLDQLFFSEVYEKDAFYPTNVVSLSSVQSYRSYPFVSASFCPVQYNPVTGIIKCYTKITYRVSWKNKDYVSEAEVSGDDALPLNYSKMPSLLKGVLADYVPAEDSMGNRASLRNGSFSKEYADYLIVTTDEYLPAVEKFKKWKSMLGYKCDVISSNWVTASDVKAAIKTKYILNDKPEYLLIVGDLGDVPSTLTDYIDDDDQVKYGPYASDLEYVCMDGRSDYIPDMAKGRIPVRNLEEAEAVLDKIINYEKNPVVDEDFYNTALHCAYFQDDIVETYYENGIKKERHVYDGYEDRRFVLTSEEIRNYMKGWGKNVNRVYVAKPQNHIPEYYSKSFSTGAKLPSDLYGDLDVWNGKTADVSKYINKGAFYVLHRDHGNYTGWGDPSFYVDDVKALENGDRLPVVFSLNCLTGGFQKMTECFSEAFLRKRDGGAVGVFGSTAISYSGRNDALAIGMFDAMYPSPGVDIEWSNGTTYKPRDLEPVFNMGQVLNKGLLTMGKINFNDPYTNAIFHYFGDPSMELRTEVPACLDAEVEKEGNIVRVKTDVPNCRISLCSVDDAGDSYVQSYENVSEATFYEVDFNFSVTVYKHNYVPFVYNGDCYIQNEKFGGDTTIVAQTIWAGNSVVENKTQGDVVVEKGIVNFYASQTVMLTSGFSVELSDSVSSFVAQVGGGVTCSGASGDPVSHYEAIETEPKEYGESDMSNEVRIFEVRTNLTNVPEEKIQDVKTYVDKGDVVVVMGDVEANVVISDLTGKRVVSQSGSGTIRLKVNRGVYIVTIVSEGDTFVDKVINE